MQESTNIETRLAPTRLTADPKFSQVKPQNHMAVKGIAPKEEDTPRLSQEDVVVDKPKVEEAAAQVNGIMKALGRDLQFEVSEGSEFLVKILEGEDIVKQIPSEEMMALKARIEKATGLILDTEI